MFDFTINFIYQLQLSYSEGEENKGDPLQIYDQTDC